MVLSAAFVSEPAKGGVVEDWNAAFESSVRAETTPPPLAARNLAILHGAMHDAVLLTQDRIRPVFSRARELTPPEAYQPAAAAVAAGHKVCAKLFPGRRAAFDELFAAQARTWPDSPTRQRSFELGRTIASIALAARENDGCTTTIHYMPREGAGHWRRTTNNRPPELPHWPQVRPFCLESVNQFRPAPPPVPDSAEFTVAREEIRLLGAKADSSRTAEQSQIAVFWSDFSYTSTPPGHWNRIARDLARNRGLSLETSARLFAVLNLALADAGLAAWDAKYQYNYWRPITAIHHAGHRQWQSYLSNPSHPEYVSAHSAFSAAAAGVLRAFFPAANVEFTVTSDALPAVTRRFNSFEVCAQEVSRSRVYGGIHYSFSGERGLELGRQVADWALRSCAADNAFEMLPAR